MDNGAIIKLNFLPYLRQGVATVIKTPAIADYTKNQINSNFDVHLSINTNPTNIQLVNATKKIHIYGPGDVTGIDHRQIIRTEPKNVTTNFEVSAIPVIEFARP